MKSRTDGWFVGVLKWQANESIKKFFNWFQFRHIDERAK